MPLNIREHLLSRDVDFNDDRVYINDETNTATFFLYNLSGILCGYQHYNPTGPKGNRATNKKVDVRDLKYQSRISKIDKIPMIAVYGLESFDYSLPYLFIVEGIFDCIKLHRLGLNAIAVLANDPIHFRSWLNTLPQKKIVITDNDDNEAGNLLEKYGDVSYKTPILNSDLGAMPLSEVRSFINNILLQYKYPIIRK